MLPVLTPSEFVALTNQTLEMAYPAVEIEGEVANYKVSKNRWVYFDITDDEAKLRCFGTVYMLPAPVEDGMRVRIVCAPRLHQNFGFSLNLQSLQFSGEGTIKKAADLLAAKLAAEGLFADERKRPVPYPPARIALVASGESAAYKDFVKVLAGRYGGLKIELADVQVQGEAAPAQIVRAIEWFNRAASVADVLVVIRGGGSADDLQAFSTEQVTRAVAASRIPTVVAIGHEVDVCLAELAADLRASTPSNAAELLVPDRREQLKHAERLVLELHAAADELVAQQLGAVISNFGNMSDAAKNTFDNHEKLTAQLTRTLSALSPQAILDRGYSIVRQDGKVIKSIRHIRPGNVLGIELADGKVTAKAE